MGHGAAGDRSGFGTASGRGGGRRRRRQCRRCRGHGHRGRGLLQHLPGHLRHGVHLLRPLPPAAGGQSLTPLPMPMAPTISWAASFRRPRPTAGGRGTCSRPCPDDDEQRPVTDDALGRNAVFFLPYLMGERSPHKRSRRPGRLFGHGSGHHPRPDDPGGAGGRGLRHPRQCRDRPEPGADHRQKRPVRRRRQERAVAQNHGQCAEHRLGGARIRAGGRLWRGDSRHGGRRCLPIRCARACRALQTPRTVYHPDPAIAARYEARYQVFRTLYPALREIYPTFA